MVNSESAMRIGTRPVTRPRTSSYVRSRLHSSNCTCQFALLYALIAYVTCLGTTKYTYTHSTIRPSKVYRELLVVHIRLLPISVKFKSQEDSCAAYVLIDGCGRCTAFGMVETHVEIASGVVIYYKIYLTTRTPSYNGVGGAQFVLR